MLRVVQLVLRGGILAITVRLVVKAGDVLATIASALENTTVLRRVEVITVVPLGVTMRNQLVVPGEGYRQLLSVNVRLVAAVAEGAATNVSGQTTVRALLQTKVVTVTD